METINYQEINIQELEVKIEKYPMAESPHLLDNFLIIGYEEIYLEQVIIKRLDLKDFYQIKEKRNNIGEKDLNGVSIINEYKCKNFPTILSSISSNFNEGNLDGNQIIHKVFPIPPSIYYSNDEVYRPYDTNVIFTYIHNNNVNIGYGFIFYELKKINNKLKICMPKAFVILSQYPYFKVFTHLCREIKKLYDNSQLQIPIEIQIFNIVNFIPPPVNSHMNMVLLLNEDLFEINKCNTQKEFFNKNNEIYVLSQLSGYRFPEIIFTKLFDYLPVTEILEVYFGLICGKTIGFFSEKIEILNSVMYMYQQFFFPLFSNENIGALSPTKYFYGQNISQNIVGFLCKYEDLEKFNPSRELKKGEFRFLSKEEEDENKELEPLFFKCDYIVDLDKKELKEQEKNINIKRLEENIKLRKYFQKLFKKREYYSTSLLENYISNLVQKLREISFKITNYNKIIFSAFFDLTDREELFNREILDAFYRFNLNISYLYYLKISKYNGDYNISKEDNIKSKEESNLDEEEYLFLSSFSNSVYCNSLINFVGGYSPKVPKIYKTPKRIFENLLALKKIFINDKEEYFENILGIYDLIYNIKGKKIYI